MERQASPGVIRQLGQGRRILDGRGRNGGSSVITSSTKRDGVCAAP
jgi:hypothetical protein